MLMDEFSDEELHSPPSRPTSLKIPRLRPSSSSFSNFDQFHRDQRRRFQEKILNYRPRSNSNNNVKRERRRLKPRIHNNNVGDDDDEDVEEDVLRPGSSMPTTPFKPGHDLNDDDYFDQDSIEEGRHFYSQTPGQSCSSWTEGTGNYFLQPDSSSKFRSSNSSIDSPTAPKKRYGKSPLLRSPRSIPRFLRNSFNKLWHRKSESPSTSLGNNSVDNPADNSPYKEDDPSIDNEDEDELSYEIYGPIPMTPSTRDFIEETRLRGLPLIPFKYPSCYLNVDKSRRITQTVPSEEDEDEVLKTKVNPNISNNLSNNDPTPSSITLAKEEPRDLQSILTEANKQLVDEHLTKKKKSADWPDFDLHSFPFFDDENLPENGSKETSPEYLEMKSVTVDHPDSPRDKGLFK